MKLVDGGEFFQAKETKEFGEYKEFKATASVSNEKLP